MPCEVSLQGFISSEQPSVPAFAGLTASRIWLNMAKKVVPSMTSALNQMAFWSVAVTAKVQTHLKAGAKKVVFQPLPGMTPHTIVMGVNEDTYKTDIKCVSCAACTTNGGGKSDSRCQGQAHWHGSVRSYY